jgi:hypothetical protein
MGNTLLTIDMITQEALRVLNNNLKFCKTIDRQHDSSFGKEGAKIGSTLRIRKPAQYTVSTGATLSGQGQDTVEEYGTLTCGTQAHIGMNFTSSELTLSLDEFSDRVIKPAMVRLANYVDATTMSNVYKSVYNFAGTAGTAPGTITAWMAGIQTHNEFCAPQDNELYIGQNPASEAATIVALSGLFNDNATIGKQYTEGRMRRALGYNWFMSQNMPTHTVGTMTTATTMSVSTTVSTDTTVCTIKCNAGSLELKIGDVITMAAVNAVNPASKINTGALQYFVVTADTTVNTTGVNVSVQPPINVSDNGRKTVTAYPQGNAAVVLKTGAMATDSAKSFAQNLMYHKDAFTMATADLVIPQGVDMAARKVLEGVSMRIVRQYDINSDKLITRCDVLFGSLCQRPELAVRVTG